MSHVVRFVDGKFGCWSRVDLDSGEPITISVIQTGVVIKKSRTGIFGPTLFDEREVIRAAMTAQVLNSQITSYATPTGITNAVLRVYTQVALDSTSVTALCARLFDARKAA
jgi:hypothetical protein